MKIRILQATDIPALMQFELDNRAWFEQFIYGRGDAFYTRQGIVQHVEECLNHLKAGLMYPALILDDGDAMIGRINLRHIDKEKSRADLGYRLASRAAGRGLATVAVQQILQHARNELSLAQIDAYVTVDNPASSRVLSKNGFRLQQSVKEMSVINGLTLDGYHYVRTL